MAQQKLNINKKDLQGNTAFLLAYLNNKVDIANYLID